MTGQTSDAISAYTRVKITEAPRWLRKVYSTVCHLQVTCEIQKSTSGGLLCISGSHTFVPISWMCKKQTAVSHSSAESEIMSLDAGSRMEGLLALQFWVCVLETLSSKPAVGDLERHKCERVIPSHSHADNCVFWVNWPCSTQHSQQLTFNLTRLVRRQCGSNPNDQQRTKPKP